MTYSEKELLNTLDQLIDNHLQNPNFTVDHYCRELKLSRSQLFRLVKEYSQLSISLYIRQRKLLKAKELLDNSNLKIAEITYQVGIDSPQSFSKFFTHEFGISPTEYRKNRFVIEGEVTDVVTEELSMTDESEFDTPTIDQSLIQPIKKYLYLGISLAFLMFTVLGFYFQKKLYQPKNTEGVTNIANNDNSIAILPFKNEGKPETAFFSEGVMEQFYSSLALIESLKVISKSSSSLFSNSKKTVPQIAKELNVNYIVEGMVLQLSDKVRINIELIEGTQDRVMWAKSYEGNPQDIGIFLKNATKEIALKLNSDMSIQLMQQMDDILTVNPEAYKEYLQGRQLFLTREKAKIEASILKFDKAIQLDPQFSIAYATKAAAYFGLGDFQHMPRDSSFIMAEKSALTALRIDSKNGMAYGVLANIYRNQNKWEQAITTFQIALKYSPNDAQINQWYSLVLRSIGHFDEAIKFSSKAVALDPLQSITLVAHIGNCSYAKKFDLAWKAIKNGEMLFDKSFFYHWAVAFYHINLGDYHEALKSLNIAHELYPSMKSTNYTIAYLQGKLGQDEKALKYIQSLELILDNYPALATVYAGLGDKEQCIKYLELGAERNLLPDYLKVSPIFSFLHNDKRFQVILQKIGLTNPVFDLLK